MISIIYTAVCCGIEGNLINVETDISGGLPTVNIVGLASTTVMESKERIKSAIINSGFEYPRKRITVNLSPAGIRKNGSCMDLAMAVGILTSALYLDVKETGNYGIVGELSLDGRVNPVQGILPILICFKEAGIKKVIIPKGNLEESIIIDEIEVYSVESLRDCAELLCGYRRKPDKASVIRSKYKYNLDFADIKGQENAKRAISIAVAGRHGLLMLGPPGCGKTMLAKRVPTIMPEMTAEEMLETAIVYSVVSDKTKLGINLGERPFRQPHSSIGKAGLLGGGVYPVPGELTLANKGVLFLDEVCEFARENIDALRVPLEERKIVHFRQGVPYAFPADFQLILASNPCPCGFYGDPEKLCTCSTAQLETYRRRLSGPVIDRVDMRIEMEPVCFEQIGGFDDEKQTSESLSADVERAISFARKCGRTLPNSMIDDDEVPKHCRLGQEELDFIGKAYERLNLNPRSYYKVLKVARTIADMDESLEIRCEHLAEALSYRIITEVNGGR